MDTEKDVLPLLNHAVDGTIPPEDALFRLKLSPFEDLDYTKVGHHRGLRQGMLEVIYGQSKTSGQITGILGVLRSHGCKNIPVTRTIQETADLIAKDVETAYEPLAKLAIALPGGTEKHGSVVMATGGINDMGVTEEVALTAEALGNSITWVYDVGVAGLHRLLSNLKPLTVTWVMIVVTSVKEALAGVIGGLVDCPVITVPTSIGYGANFGGVAALLSMLNSHAPGVSVVGIDNGFDAGCLVSQINHTGEPTCRSVP